jgi:hypothetical protein
MELALNLIWFIIAAASYVLLVRHLASRSAERARGPSRFRCVVALGCLLAILFPVISLTDDLHDMQATMEESLSSSFIIKRCGVNRHSTPECTPYQLLHIVALFGAIIGWVSFGIMAGQRTARQSSEQWFTALDRAPPSSLLP